MSAKNVTPKPAGRTKPALPTKLPGDMSDHVYIEQMLRVNHAGEFGAQRIYRGQLAILKDHDIADVLEHMADQEQEHLEYFERELVHRRIRPTALYPLWNVFGYALGCATALLGKEAAMACTVAVEEVIDEHYEEQLQTLDEKTEKSLKNKIRKFQADELEHRDIGLDNDAELAPAYQLLIASVKTITKKAIWLSKRI